MNIMMGLIIQWMLYAMHLNDNSVLVFMRLKISSPNSPVYR